VDNLPRQPETPLLTGDWSAVPDVHRFGHRAMATLFEVVIQHEDPAYARQAARAAFDEADRLEGHLSRFLETSDITRINHLPANQPAQLSLDAFACLALSAEVSAETGGAFDVTVGFLVDCWIEKENKMPRTPSSEELEFARAHAGMDLILFDEPTHAVALLASPVRVDLGGVGKGYAVDRMAELLREWGVARALLHGGFSSVLALDAPRDMPGWPVTLSHPRERRRTLARLSLEHVSVSGSGVEQGRHIIDPRSGRPTQGKIGTWSLAPDAGRADALSTAFMIMTPQEVQDYCLAHPPIRALLVVPSKQAEGSVERIISAGPWKPGELVI
jgi:thiamine biosynthesis lipoprotein